MADGLPEGLVTHSQGITGEIDRIDRVEPEDIAQLWKVYSVNKAVIADGVGRRLENFFWRIWSSRKLLHRMSGRQLALQFQRISEGGYIRTTPTQSPRISRSLGGNETGSPSHGTVAASPREISPSVDRARVTNEGQDHRRERDSPGSQAESVLPPTHETLAPPTSILKKPKAASAAHSSKTAKVLSPAASPTRKSGDDDDEGVSSSANAPCTELVNDEGSSSSQARKQLSAEESVGPNIEDERGRRSRVSARERSMMTEKSTGPQEDVKPKSTRKPTAVRVKGGAMKRRPVMAQRKSSQSSSSATSQLTASPATGTKFGSTASTHATEANAEKTTRDQAQPVIQRSRHGSPHPSQRRSAAMENKPFIDDTHEKPKSEVKGIEDGLVDRDFRARFAIHSRADGRLFAPFPGKSTAAAATSAVDQAIGTTDSALNGKGKRSEHFTDEIIRLKPPGPSGPRAKDDSEAEPLPRTKSQLTLLLERDRQRNQDGSHGKEAR